MGTKSSTSGFYFCLWSEEPFQSYGEPTFKTVIPYMKGHSCIRPALHDLECAGWAGAWKTGLWAHSPALPCLSPAHRDLSQHHHPGLSPGVQLASAEWIDTLTLPEEVYVEECVCRFMRGRVKLRVRESGVLDLDSCSELSAFKKKIKNGRNSC